MRQGQVVHGTCVAINGRGLLITGASGSGKSSLALALMSLGAELVSDDRTQLSRVGGAICATAPITISGLIEARGLGLLRAHVCDKAKLCAVLQLDQTEQERLPPKRDTEILSISVPLLYRVEGTHFAAALLQYLKCGVVDPDEHL